MEETDIVQTYYPAYEFKPTELSAEVSQIELEIAEIDQSGTCIVKSNSRLVVQNELLNQTYDGKPVLPVVYDGSENSDIDSFFE